MRYVKVTIVHQPNAGQHGTQRLLLSRAIHGDDTGVKLRVAGAGQAAKTPTRA